MAVSRKVLRTLACAGWMAGLLFVRADAQGGDAMEPVELRARDLVCVAGNNAPWGDAHKAGYNGLISLHAPDENGSAFVPAYAGLNLEHYFDARPRDPDANVFFEPRHAPMTLARIDAQTVELHQPETPVFGVESWTRFTVSEPYYVDMLYRCVPHKAEAFPGGWMGVFWASYINAPLDKSLYFLAEGSSLDKPQWVQYCTQTHGRDSTVLGPGAPEVPLPVPSGGLLFASLSPLRYAEPFFYGRVRDKVMIFLFERDPRIRFSHSPSGGGPTTAGDDTCPAWDFQFIVPDCQAGTEYSLRMRLVYKPWIDRADVLREARAWFAEAKSTP